MPSPARFRFEPEWRITLFTLVLVPAMVGLGFWLLQRAGEKAILADPNDAEAHYNLGVLLEDHFEDYEAARKCYEEAILADPNNADAPLRLGGLLETHLKDFHGN